MRPCVGPLILATLFFLSACVERPEPALATDTYSRVVALAPNLTELTFAAGAGSALVGVSAYSDYPAAARTLPLVGDAFTIDQEQLALLNPDLLLAWQAGTPAHVIDELRNAGYRVEVLRTRSLDDVAAALRRIGVLTGYPETADRAASAYTEGLQSIREAYAGAEEVTVFYQVSARPLYTVNGQHYVSELIGLCGGRNVFADLDELAPAIAVEAVVERDPDVMLASTDASGDAFAEWSRWPNMAANRYANQFLMPADEIGRATPRLVEAATALCDALTIARKRMASELR